MERDRTFNIKQLLSVKVEPIREGIFHWSNERVFHAVTIIKNLNVNSFERLKDQ